jgi:hypothetical protein
VVEVSKHAATKCLCSAADPLDQNRATRSTEDRRSAWEVDDAEHSVEEPEVSDEGQESLRGGRHGSESEVTRAECDEKQRSWWKRA